MAVEVEELIKFELGDNKYSLIAEAASHVEVNVEMHQNPKKFSGFTRSFIFSKAH